jgi:hypothetical protein
MVQQPPDGGGGGGAAGLSLAVSSSLSYLRVRTRELKGGERLAMPLSFHAPKPSLSSSRARFALASRSLTSRTWRRARPSRGTCLARARVRGGGGGAGGLPKRRTVRQLVPLLRAERLLGAVVVRDVAARDLVDVLGVPARSVSVSTRATPLAAGGSPPDNPRAKHPASAVEGQSLVALAEQPAFAAEGHFSLALAERV